MTTRLQTTLVFSLLCAFLSFAGSDAETKIRVLCDSLAAQFPDSIVSPRLAVLPFTDNTGKGQGRSVAEMVVSCLQKNRRFLLVDRMEFQKALAEIELSQTDVIDSASALRGGEMVSAPYLLTGIVSAIFGSCRINARIIQTETLRIFSSAWAAVSQSELDGLTKELLGERGKITAALFVSELGIDKLVQKRRKLPENNSFEAPADPRSLKADTLKSMPAVIDIDKHWARNFILDIVNLEILGLEPYPDHTFRPDDPVNRGEYAMMVEDVLIAILGDQSLASKNIGDGKSRFPDVNPSHPAYNAICNAVDKNIMDAEMNGAFGPEKSVSGADALPYTVFVNRKGIASAVSTGYDSTWNDGIFEKVNAILTE